MNLNDLYKKALDLDTLTIDEGLFLYEKAPGEELMFFGNMIRQVHNPGNRVGWIIDRNVNITNVCFSQCLFCNFCRKKNSPDAYITSRAEYIKKINELFTLGGNQILLQGGMHPDLGLDYYTSLFRELKELYPKLKLHALGPPEVINLSWGSIVTSDIGRIGQFAGSRGGDTFRQGAQNSITGQSKYQGVVGGYDRGSQTKSANLCHDDVRPCGNKQGKN